MARLGAEEIYAFARDAGFSPDQAVTMTAIALAESGGNTGAHNPNNEDSRGLWQINLEAHSTAPWAQGLQMYNPRDNAIAAWHVSQNGADIRPWTVTHGDRGSRYADFAEEARQAAATYGEPANGNFDGPANYYDDPVSAGAGGDQPFDGPVPLDAPAVSVAPGSVETDTPLERFLKLSVAQAGDPYDSAHGEPSPDDPNPDTLDCSELVQWAAHQTGVEITDGSWLQHFEMIDRGGTVSVEEALMTPGALLFRFDPPPTRTGGRPSDAHVAISLGDGRTIEAQGTSSGILIADNAASRGWTSAAVIPEFRGQSVDMQEVLEWTGRDDAVAELLAIPLSTDPAPAMPPVAPAAPDPLAEAAMHEGGRDRDVDMLPDHFEVRYGLKPKQPDTDGDGITDGYELIVIGTQPDLADTDFDQMSDGLEISLGLDPLVADNPDMDVGLTPPEDLLLDTDGDGLADWGEELAGTARDDPDSDDDLVLDGDELMRHTDPLVADT